ncbi:shieldin complex subunit 3 [Mantella aurantiaca]
MEVVLHYRPSENTPENVRKLCAGSLEDFPARHLPRFVPWFPRYITSFILKPQRCPPLPSDFCSKMDHGPFNPLHMETLYYDPTPSLLEFKANVNAENNQQIASCKDIDLTCCSPAVNEIVSDTRSRTWSICTRRARNGDTLIQPSEELKAILDKLSLNILHRGRWTILPLVCGAMTLEEVWWKLSRLLRDKVLPSCNATIQRDIKQIWIFCDLRYCEHIGSLVRSELKLSGKIELSVRKHGPILSM